MQELNLLPQGYEPCEITVSLICVIKNIYGEYDTTPHVRKEHLMKKSVCVEQKKGDKHFRVSPYLNYIPDVEKIQLLKATKYRCSIIAFA